MAAVKPALQKEPSRDDAPAATPHNNVARLAAAVPRRATQTPAASPSGIRPITLPINQPRKETSFQARTPVITGEATYRGTFPVDGIITGQLGAAGSALNLLQFPTLNHRCDVTGGVREPECRALLQRFFAEQRERSKAQPPE